MIQKHQPKIVYGKNISIQGNPNSKTHISNKYLASGVYKLTYEDCAEEYTENWNQC